jgi:hypothetical protein
MAAKTTKEPKEMTDVKSGDAAGKTKALGMALESIEKQFGKGSIMKLLAWTLPSVVAFRAVAW